MSQLRRFYERARGVVRLARLDRIKPNPTPTYARTRAWSLGWMDWTYRVCDIDNVDSREYLPTLPQVILSEKLIEAHPEIIDDKLCFAAHMGSLGVPTPKIIAEVDEGRIAPVGQPILQDPARWLEDNFPFVLKPRASSSGIGVHIFEQKGDAVTMDGHPYSMAALERRIQRTHGCLISQKVEQSSFASSLYHRSVNTIRALTYVDPQDDRAKLGAAVFRVGNARTGIIDNFKGGTGGLSVHIDLASGRLGWAKTVYKDFHMESFDRHPDTDAPIRGQVIPDWSDVRAAIERVAGKLPFMKLLFWDVALTETGPTFIEANPGVGLTPFQVHEGIMKNEGLARFYRHHGFV